LRRAEGFVANSAASDDINSVAAQVHELFAPLQHKSVGQVDMAAGAVDLF
jgi:hypothetical protein